MLAFLLDGVALSVITTALLPVTGVGRSFRSSWSIEVRDAAGTVHDVKIDAGNAAVLGTQADEDGAAE